MDGAQSAYVSAPIAGASLLAALTYADLFDYPLDAREVAVYQVGTGMSLAEVRRWLDTEARPGGAVVQVDGYYCLPGRQETVAIRQERTAASQKVWRRARFYVKWLARLPFVRMVAVTGSLAVSNVSGRPDIDLLVAAEPGRVWVCRRLLVACVRLARSFGDEICPNYVIASDALALQQQDFFTAHELAQMVPLYGADVYGRLLRENAWAREFLPAAFDSPAAPGVVPRARIGTVRRAAETLLQLGPFDLWERWEMRRLQRKLRPYIGSTAEVVCAPHQCKGHTSLHRRSILARYRGRLEHIGLGSVTASTGEIDGIVE